MTSLPNEGMMGERQEPSEEAMPLISDVEKGDTPFEQVVAVLLACLNFQRSSPPPAAGSAESYRHQGWARFMAKELRGRGLLDLAKPEVAPTALRDKGLTREDRVELWHNANTQPLQEFLGMTWDEYARWVEDPAALDSREEGE